MEGIDEHRKRVPCSLTWLPVEATRHFLTAKHAIEPYNRILARLEMCACRPSVTICYCIRAYSCHTVPRLGAIVCHIRPIGGDHAIWGMCLYSYNKPRPHTQKPYNTLILSHIFKNPHSPTIGRVIMFCCLLTQGKDMNFFQSVPRCATIIPTLCYNCATKCATLYL